MENKNYRYVAENYFDLSNEGNLTEIEKLFTEESVYNSQNTGLYYGRNQIMSMIREFFKKFISLKWDIIDTKELNNKSFVIDFNMYGKKNNGEEINVYGLEYVEISQGKIKSIKIVNK